MKLRHKKPLNSYKADREVSSSVNKHLFQEINQDDFQQKIITNRKINTNDHQINKLSRILVIFLKNINEDYRSKISKSDQARQQESLDQNSAKLNTRRRTNKDSELNFKLYQNQQQTHKNRPIQNNIQIQKPVIQINNNPHKIVPNKKNKINKQVEKKLIQSIKLKSNTILPQQPQKQNQPTQNIKNNLNQQKLNKQKVHNNFQANSSSNGKNQPVFSNKPSQPINNPNISQPNLMYNYYPGNIFNYNNMNLMWPGSMNMFLQQNLINFMNQNQFINNPQLQNKMRQFQNVLYMMQRGAMNTVQGANFNNLNLNTYQNIQNLLLQACQRMMPPNQMNYNIINQNRNKQKQKKMPPTQKQLFPTISKSKQIFNRSTYHISIAYMIHVRKLQEKGTKLSDQNALDIIDPTSKARSVRDRKKSADRSTILTQDGLK